MRRLLLVPVLLPLAACPPPCGQVCKKVLFDCELDTERVALEECENACDTQAALYDAWDDERLQHLFDDHRRCVGRSSCEELAQGSCYEGFEDLYVFDPGKELPAPATLRVTGALAEAAGASVVGIVTPPGDATATVTAAATAEGSFELVFPDVLTPGHGYTVDLFVDANGSGACDPAEAASAYRIAVFQNPGDIDRTVALDTSRHAAPEACAPVP